MIDGCLIVVVAVFLPAAVRAASKNSRHVYRERKREKLRRAAARQATRRR